MLEQGSLVRFNPPEGAYSLESLQYKFSGHTGLIAQLFNDSYGLVMFGAYTSVLVNTAYLEPLVHKVFKRSGQGPSKRREF